MLGVARCSAASEDILQPVDRLALPRAHLVRMNLVLGREPAPCGPRAAPRAPRVSKFAVNCRRRFVVIPVPPPGSGIHLSQWSEKAGPPQGSILAGKLFMLKVTRVRLSALAPARAANDYMLDTLVVAQQLTGRALGGRRRSCGRSIGSSASARAQGADVRAPLGLVHGAGCGPDHRRTARQGFSLGAWHGCEPPPIYTWPVGPSRRQPVRGDSKGFLRNRPPAIFRAPSAASIVPTLAGRIERLAIVACVVGGLALTAARRGASGTGPIRAGERRTVARTRTRRLADVPADLRRVGIQPAGPDRCIERRGSVDVPHPCGRRAASGAAHRQR